MAIAHLCLRCGQDLARIRSEREPHYGLNIVRCPQCSTVAARRRHPQWSWFRRVRRLDRALTILFLQLSASIVLLVANVVLAMIIVVFLMHGGWSREDEAALALASTIVTVGVLTGMWLTVGLGHWRRWVAWSTFFGMTALITAGVGVLIAAGSIPQSAARQSDVRVFGMLMEPDVWLLILVAVPWGIIAVAGLALIALLGIGPGRIAAWLFHGARRWAWRSSRRRRREGRLVL